MKKAIACLLLALAFVAVLEPHVREWIVDKASVLIQKQEEPVQQTQEPSFSRQLGRG